MRALVAGCFHCRRKLVLKAQNLARFAQFHLKPEFQSSGEKPFSNFAQHRFAVCRHTLMDFKSTAPHIWLLSVFFAVLSLIKAWVIHFRSSD